MSFINANTANPNASTTPLGAIGYTQIVPVPSTTPVGAVIAGPNAYINQSLFTVPTTGVWLINASVYVANNTSSSPQLSAVQLNILLPTTSGTLSYSNESASMWFSGVYIQSTALNVTTVQWANANDTFGIAIASSGYFYITTTTHALSVLTATKIA